MRVPLVDLTLQYHALKEEMDRAVAEVFGSQRFILGPVVEAFEREAASYLEVPHALGVASGTDALLLSLLALGMGPGDEVITTPYTFFATAGAIVRAGATPVFADIDAETLNLDPAHVEKRITGRSRALLPVHLFGRPAAMEALMALAEAYGLAVIEDAAQAMGAVVTMATGLTRAGTVGATGCFSFFPSKNLGGCGDGGLVVTSREEVAERVRLLREHGSERRYYQRLVGVNSRLDALQAAVLRVKLPHLDRWNRRRGENAAYYRAQWAARGLTQGPEAPVALLAPGEPPEHIYHQCVVRVRNRDGLKAFLAARDIASEVYYPVPLHLQECFRPLGYRPGDLPEAERAAAETLALPIFPDLTRAQQDAVVEAMAAFYGA